MVGSWPGRSRSHGTLAVLGDTLTCKWGVRHPGADGGEALEGLGQGGEQEVAPGHREERMQLLLGLAGITQAAFPDTRTEGCGLRLRGGCGLGVRGGSEPGHA